MRWLVDPRADAPAEVRARLLFGLLSSPGAIIMGALDGLIINAVALWLHGDTAFAVFAVLEIACGASRLAVLRAIARAGALGRPRPIDLSVTMSIVWCALQGAMSFTAMLSGNGVLQTLSASMIMGIIGPICARNYPAPRLAMLLIALCDFPFVSGACVSGQFWMLVLVPMTPPFLFGSWQIVTSLQRMALNSLIAEFDSRNRAYHDSLTGLLNRRAFTEAMGDLQLGLSERFALLCLDLDGFKSVNDTLGHHAGDCLLAGVAERLTASVRGEDHLFRLGGDEFVILLRGVPAEAVGPFSNRIISAVSDDLYQLDGFPPVRIGVSVGFTCCPEDGQDAAELHRMADLALYESKAAGKGVHRRFRIPVDA